MKKETRNGLITGAIGIVLVIIAFLLGRCTYECPEPETIEKHDTMLIHSVDTVTVHKDSIVYKDRVILDTFIIRDTFLVSEQLTYEDSLSKIWVSGINPAIDSIVHYIPRDTVIINNDITHVVKKKWNFGIGVGGYVGAGVGYNPLKGSFGVNAPEVGVGVIVGIMYCP